MEKTKFFALVAALAILTVVAVAGAVYAQTISNPTSSPSIGAYRQTSQVGNFATGLFGFRCPWLSGNLGGIGSQSGYGSQSRIGMGRGMMGR